MTQSAPPFVNPPVTEAEQLDFELEQAALIEDAAVRRRLYNALIAEAVQYARQHSFVHLRKNEAALLEAAWRLRKLDVADRFFDEKAAILNNQNALDKLTVARAGAAAGTFVAAGLTLGAAVGALQQKQLAPAITALISILSVTLLIWSGSKADRCVETLTTAENLMKLVKAQRTPGQRVAAPDEDSAISSFEIEQDRSLKAVAVAAFFLLVSFACFLAFI